MNSRALTLALWCLTPVVALCDEAPPPPQDVWTGKGQAGLKKLDMLETLNRVYAFSFDIHRKRRSSWDYWTDCWADWSAARWPRWSMGSSRSMAGCKAS